MGQLGGAVSDLTSALDIEPKSIATRLERADLFVRLCSFESADGDFQAVLTAKSDHDGALQGSERVTAGRAHLETAQVRARFCLCAPACLHSSLDWVAQVCSGPICYDDLGYNVLNGITVSADADGAS